MNRSLFHRLSDALWIVIVSFIVLLAVYVSVGRMLASLTGNYQQVILRELNHRLPFTVEARKVSAQWHSFTPSLVLEDLRLTLPTAPDHPLELAGGRIGLDVAGSLLNRNLQTTRLELNGLHLAGELSASGQLRIRGFDGDDTALGKWAEQFILNVEHLVLAAVSLKLDLPGGERRDFQLDFELTRDGSRRRLETRLSSSRGLQLRALAQGLGNPFDAEAFAGRLYLDITAGDVGALMDLAAPRLPSLTLSGSANLEAWLSWDRGQPSLESRWQSRDLVIGSADGSWSVPLDLLRFEASAIERRDHWGLSLAAVEVARGEALLRVPRLQLEASGATVRLRASQVPLGPFAAIAGDIPSLGESATAVLRELQPGGTVQALQLQFDDINDPLAGWELQADFSEVAVLPWHGAPGVTGGRGHVSLGPGGGFVTLDSRDFSMVFPTVYESPLGYEDFHGTFDLAWNDEAVILSSQLVQALGPEGPVRVLFGLTVPLQERREGIEMDLLVGLKDSGPGHRGKYIPSVLDEGLRDWLQASIGDGVIEGGGFIWRGSLTAAEPALHTVQLFFNIEDTALTYHPDWPSLEALSGTVLIDDSRVSVWADSARLRDSLVTDLDVELWTDRPGQLMLAVAGAVAGPAADALATINESPLAELTAGGFADWRLQGRLDTDIELLLNLSDVAAVPAVRVTAELDEVDLDVEPGRLPVRAVSGRLDYSSEEGFSANKLVGRLWGRPLEAVVRRGEASPGAAGQTAGGTSSTVIDLASSLAMTDVQTWLEQDWLAFARGEASVTARMSIEPGSAPSLTIESPLQGVELDLPAPWAKAADERRPLALALVFAADETSLDIELEGGLKAGLVLVDGGLEAAALGFGSEPVLEQGVFQLGGRLEQADVDQWRLFGDTYLSGGAGAVEMPAATDRSLQLRVDHLEVRQLRWRESDLGEFVFRFEERDEHWSLAAQSDWLQARWTEPLGGEGEPLLAIARLDLAGLDRLQAAGDEVGIVELPAMQVALSRLENSGELLGSLDLALRSRGALLEVDDITGSILGMTLSAERPGRLEWHQGDDNRTRLAVTPRFGNLGETLTRLGYPPFLVTDSGEFDVVLEWPGAPQAFELAAAEGVVRVDIGQGQFTEVSAGASGTLRVVSILNLAEIVRQLSLSHMFESGIPFNTIQGEVFLHGGSIEVTGMDVEGGASRFQFTGVSEVRARTLNGELVVTLPVANNLPWVAALTAGLPVAAGVFVLSKLFENQVNRLTSLVYKAGGSWDAPEVTFDRVFDDTAAAGRAAPRQSPPVP